MLLQYHPILKQCKHILVNKPLPNLSKMDIYHSSLTLLIIFLQQYFLAGCIEFNREYTGVKFWPYVKNAENNLPIPKRHAYSFAEVKTMLEVVSTKFSRVYTPFMDLYALEYSPNKTYYFESYVLARTAEAAAQINRERNNKSIVVMMGIYYEGREKGRRMDAEIKLAFEAADKAEAIFPGTVEGFAFRSSADDLDWARKILPLLKYVRNTNSNRMMRTGLVQGCSRFQNLNPKYEIIDNTSSPSNASELLKLKREILINSDFFVCELSLHPNEARFGAKTAIHGYGRLFLRYRSDMRLVNNDITVAIEVGWPSAGTEMWKTIDNMGDFWTELNNFATQNNFPVCLVEAFDNPWKGQMLSQMGWWKLTRNDLAGDASGYVEKVSGTVISRSSPEGLARSSSDSPSSGSNDSNLWIWIALAVGIAVVVVVVLTVFLYKFYTKMNTLTEVLTKQDINDFKFGTAEPNLYEDGQVCGSALKMPYDQSLEIKKELLEIMWDQILGSGEFGQVHKARIKNATMSEVALKMTKRNCPGTALKGLLSEIKVLSYLGKHPNIVSICGAYTAELEKGTVYMATELCTLGSLKSHLVNYQKNANENERPTSFKEMIRWSQDIASGMEYLGEIKGVVHADLATRNVLLGADGVAKITDFGLSRRLYDYANYMKRQQEPLPWRWMSLESLKILEFSVKSDVWSYGVTLWEIFSLGDQPFPGLSWNADFIESLENGMRMKQPRLATAEIYQIMMNCWELKPDKRPKFSDLKMQARKLYDEVGETDDAYMVLDPL